MCATLMAAAATAPSASAFLSFPSSLCSEDSPHPLYALLFLATLSFALNGFLLLRPSSQAKLRSFLARIRCSLPPLLLFLCPISSSCLSLPTTDLILCSLSALPLLCAYEGGAVCASGSGDDEG